MEQPESLELTTKQLTALNGQLNYLISMYYDCYDSSDPDTSDYLKFVEELTPIYQQTLRKLNLPEPTDCVWMRIKQHIQHSDTIKTPYKFFLNQEANLLYQVPMSQAVDMMEHNKRLYCIGKVVKVELLEMNSMRINGEYFKIVDNYQGLAVVEKYKEEM